MSHNFVNNGNMHNHFSMIPHQLADDRSISFGAKGLLLYLLSKPPEWSVHTWQLAEVYQGDGRGNGKSAVMGWINELRDSKYIIYGKANDEKGQWKHEYHVYSLPFPVYQKMFPEVVKPAMVNPAMVKPVLSTKIKLDKNELEEPPPPTSSSDPFVLPILKKLVVVPLFLKTLERLPENLARQLLVAYDEDLIREKVEMMLSSGEYVEKPFGWLRDALRNDWQPTITSKDLERANGKLLRDSFGHLDGKIFGGRTTHVGPTYIEFAGTGSQKSIVIKIQEKEFEVKVRKCILNLQNGVATFKTGAG